MSQELKYTAVIIGKYDIGEVDRSYILYTRESGKVRLIAKGVKKGAAKLAGNLETLNLVEVYAAKGRGQGKIVGAIALESFLGIRSRGEVLQNVFDIFRLVSRIISEEEKDERIFELLLSFLEILEKLSREEKFSEEKMKLVRLGFIFKLLDSLGYQVQVGRCLVCEKNLEKENNYFSVQKGGVLCRNCAKLETLKMPISQNAIKIIRLFLTNKLENLTKIQANEKDLRNLESITVQFLKWIG